MSNSESGSGARAAEATRVQKEVERVQALMADCESKDDEISRLRSLVAGYFSAESDNELLRLRIKDLETKISTLRSEFKSTAGTVSNSMAVTKSEVGAETGAIVSAIPKFPKLTSFSHKGTDPKLWFSITEAAFRRARVVEEGMMLDAIIPYLDSEAMMTIRDLLITTPQPHDIYSKAKLRIIDAFVETPEQQLRNVLKAKIPAHYKPTQILAYLRAQNSCVNNACSDDIIRSIFLEHLNPRHKEILSVLGTVGLDALAKAADKLADMGCAGSQIEVVSQDQVKLASHSSHDSKANETPFEQLLTSFNEFKISTRNSLKELHRALQSHRQTRLNKSIRSRSKSPLNDNKKASIANDSSNQPRPRDKDAVCFGHKKYKDKTHTCAKWCAKFLEWVATDQKN